MKLTSTKDLYSIYLNHPDIVKDTREIKEGCLFWALKGEQFDANEFAEEALKKGAAYAIVDNPRFAIDDRFILVENSLESLQELANFHRKQLNIPIIGITGSNGKTTSKELIFAVLSQHFNTHATVGNYNNHIGVPLSLLKINQKHQISIIEMGANHQGEIDFLCTIAEPGYGIITNIGKSHLEGFGGIEGVLKGKSELYRFIEKNKGIIFQNQDDTVLKGIPFKSKTIGYGTLAKEYCSGKLVQSQPSLKGKWRCGDQEGIIQSSLYGEYNFYNILSAIAIGNYFGVPQEEIDKGIREYHSNNNRSQLIEKYEAKIYLDAYNANPSSVEASLLNFSKIKHPKKIAILGDMFELGIDSPKEHSKMIELGLDLQFQQIAFVGKNYFQHQAKHPGALFFETRDEAKFWFNQQEKKASQILIKGSRGMAMEKLLED